MSTDVCTQLVIFPKMYHTFRNCVFTDIFEAPSCLFLVLLLYRILLIYYEVRLFSVSKWSSKNNKPESFSKQHGRSQNHLICHLRFVCYLDLCIPTYKDKGLIFSVLPNLISNQPLKNHSF